MMKRLLIIALCASIFLISGCIEFRSIDQPLSTSRNETFTVCVEVYSVGSMPSWPYFGVCLPMGWSVPGDSISCTGVYGETIYYDSSLSYDQENASPAPEGYYWWAGSGASTGENTLEGIVYGELQLQTDDQTGCFSIDYMLGDSYYGVNQGRSNDHLIWVVDDHTPKGLQAAEDYNSVIMNWRPPVHSGGLLGYNIYRGQEVINTGLIVDTTYIDDNPLVGAHRYAVSSLYHNGDEHLIPHEIPVVFGEYLYVSPDGDNSNDGSSYDYPLLTISYAISIIRSDSLFPKTIMLGPGVYSPGSNGEEFPIDFISHVSLKGTGDDLTILDANSIGGVVDFTYVHDVSVSAVTLTNGGGPGISCRGSNPIIDFNTISGNTADYGGGIFCRNSSPLIINNTITGNTANDVGGGINCWLISNPILIKNTISGNIAINCGGGINCSGSANPIVINNTISDNSAQLGGGIWCGGESNASILNCILWNDAPHEISGTISAAYSCIQGGWEGDGNIDIDPLFRDPDNGDFHLMFTDCGDPFDSPCIDAGDPAIFDSLLDCNWGLGWYRSDMGAYGGGDSVQVRIEDRDVAVPTLFASGQNFPNPFNATTIIQYSLPEAAHVVIEIYDLLGRRVETLFQGEQSAGYHRITWDASDYSSGLYFYRIQAGEFACIKKMVLLK
jgi:parallel beta-helix repeat protein